MIYYVLLILLSLLLLFLYYMGVFTSLSFQDAKLGPLKIFYLEYQGEYSKIGPIFGRVSRDIAPYFKFAKLFGLYFDAPNEVVNPRQTRAIVGVILNSGENPKLEEGFAKDYIHYKKAELPIVEAVKTTFPYRNSLTYMLFGKIYREIARFVKRKYGKNAARTQTAIMEVYYMHPPNRFIEFYWPHGVNAENYLLSTAPRPQYKQGFREE